MTFTAAQLEAAGGKRWTKNGKDRVYFNDLATLYGLETTRYNSGNISSATLDGSPISNTQARKLASDLGMSKFWFDLLDGKFHHQGFMTQDDARVLANIIRQKAQGVPADASPAIRYVCEECGAELTRPFCPSCRDEMFIRAIA